MESKRFCWDTRPIANKGNIVKGEKYRFTVLTPHLIRMEYDNDGVFEDRASQSVFYRDFDENKFDVTKENGIITINTGELIVTYKENAEFCQNNLKFKLINEPATTWCFGEEFETLGGTAKTLDTINGEVPICDGVCSRNGFSVIDDSNRMVLDAQTGWVDVRKKGTLDLYFFGYGFNYREAIRDYYRLTGIPPLLPAYALGNWWSRYYKYTQQGYLDLIDKFKRENVPFSVGVIDMDWHKTELPKDLIEDLKKEYTGMESGWTGYSWNRELFPDYKQLLKDLKERNLKVALNLHPAQGVRKHEDQFVQMATEMGLDPEKENIVPFDILSPKYMEKYFDVLHHPYEDAGVDFWWMDYQQGLSYWWNHKINDNSPRDEREMLDPLWMLNHLHIIDISRDGKRPMFFSRFCGEGSQRYPVGFSGDTFVTWDSLNFQPYFTATASNIGYGWWSHDIGGHMAGYRDDELNVRWIQLGVFSPINRLHSSPSDFVCKEPWCYDERSEKIIRKWLNLRHDLFPYLYTMNYRNHNELIPLILPMYYSHPKCDGAYNVPNQYWFGSELVVAPITKPCRKSDKLGDVRVWMPKGHWFDFFNGTHYYSDKNRYIDVFRTIEEYPVFAKAGAIVPTSIRNEGDNRLVNSPDMKITVFPGDSNSFVMYEDGGDGYEYTNGDFVTTKMDIAWGEKAVFTINGAIGNVDLLPKTRNWTIALKGFNKDIRLTVFVNSVETPVLPTWNNDENCYAIEVQSEVTDKLEVVIEGENLINDNSDCLGRIKSILQHSHMEINRKERIYQVILNDAYKLHQKIFNIYDCSPEQEHLAKAIRELLTLTSDEFYKFDGWNWN